MNIPAFQSREKAGEDAYIRKREAEKAAAAAAAKQNTVASQPKTQTGQTSMDAGNSS
jgi:hypothetical protein